LLGYADRAAAGELAILLGAPRFDPAWGFVTEIRIVWTGAVGGSEDDDDAADGLVTRNAAYGRAIDQFVLWA
jgi:hypothetical protein